VTDLDLSDVMSGKRLTLDELAVGISAAGLLLQKLARAAEAPATPVELSDTIRALSSLAASAQEHADRAQFLARVVAGDVPLAKTFSHGGDPWGAAARDTDRADFGGPAVVPTQWQLIRLAQQAKHDSDTTTYPEAMAGVGIGWESKEAQIRRRVERDAAVAREVLLLPCESCGAGKSEQCRTKNGRVSEKAHVVRQREAEATVDARLGYLGDMPVAVPQA
jgi:hypothetical protein